MLLGRRRADVAVKEAMVDLRNECLLGRNWQQLRRPRL